MDDLFCDTPAVSCWSVRTHTHIVVLFTIIKYSISVRAWCAWERREKRSSRGDAAPTISAEHRSTAAELHAGWKWTDCDDRCPSAVFCFPLETHANAPAHCFFFFFLWCGSAASHFLLVITRLCLKSNGSFFCSYSYINVSSNMEKKNNTKNWVDIWCATIVTLQLQMLLMKALVDQLHPRGMWLSTPAPS